MSTFQFTLESILTLRSREEEAAQEHHIRAVQFKSRAETALRDARAELEAYHHSLATAREGVSFRHDQLLFLNALQYQQAACQHLAGKLQAAERELESRRTDLLAAHHKHEVLLRLKRTQQEAHQLATQRAEESALADLINARHALRLNSV